MSNKPIAIRAEVETKRQWIMNDREGLRMIFEEVDSWEFFRKLQWCRNPDQYLIVCRREETERENVFENLFHFIMDKTETVGHKEETLVIVGGTLPLVERFNQ